MSDYKGYRCCPGQNLRRKFINNHAIMCPDKKTIRVTFAKEACGSPTFRHWVNLNVGYFDIEYQGYRYHPIRSNGWHLGLATYTHEVTSPDGTTTQAGFRAIDIAQPEFFGSYIDFGLPSPKVFGCPFLTLKLFRDLNKLCLDYNVDPLDHATLAVLLKLAA